jgi:hypothetical protein
MPPIANCIAMISIGVTNPRILCEPFVSGAAERTVCTPEEYRFAEERFTVHLDAGGYFPLCVRATDHHHGHWPLLFLLSFAWPPHPLRKRDESAVTIPRPSHGDPFRRIGMICGNGSLPGRGDDDVGELSAPVYGWFTEGDTRDVKEARRCSIILRPKDAALIAHVTNAKRRNPLCAGEERQVVPAWTFSSISFAKTRRTHS